MNRYLTIILLPLFSLFPNMAMSEDVYLFGKTIELPQNCVFYVNNKTFGCEDLSGGYVSVSFSTPDKHNFELKEVKQNKKTKPSLSEKIALDIKTGQVQGKNHTLLVFNNLDDDERSYSYTICDEKNCMSIFAIDMEFIRETLEPVANQFIFWNPVDAD